MGGLLSGAPNYASPTTGIDPTLVAGLDYGASGNKCHVDCSNRGTSAGKETEDLLGVRASARREGLGLRQSACVGPGLFSMPPFCLPLCLPLSVLCVRSAAQACATTPRASAAASAATTAKRAIALMCSRRARREQSDDVDAVGGWGRTVWRRRRRRKRRRRRRRRWGKSRAERRSVWEPRCGCGDRVIFLGCEAGGCRSHRPTRRRAKGRMKRNGGDTHPSAYALSSQRLVQLARQDSAAPSLQDREGKEVGGGADRRYLTHHSSSSSRLVRSLLACSSPSSLLRRGCPPEVLSRPSARATRRSRRPLTSPPRRRRRWRTEHPSRSGSRLRPGTTPSRRSPCSTAEQRSEAKRTSSRLRASLCSQPTIPASPPSSSPFFSSFLSPFSSRLSATHSGLPIRPIGW